MPRAAAVAASPPRPGKVKFWTTSARAGCMLYLYGDSGTTYLYIHLNNDVTKGNDNRGKCVARDVVRDGPEETARSRCGPARRLRRGLRRRQRDRIRTSTSRCTRTAAAPTNPYRYLMKAERLIFATSMHGRVTLTVEGRSPARRPEP